MTVSRREKLRYVSSPSQVADRYDPSLLSSIHHLKNKRIIRSAKSTPLLPLPCPCYRRNHCQTSISLRTYVRTRRHAVTGEEKISNDLTRSTTLIDLVLLPETFYEQTTLPLSFAAC